MMLDRFKYLTLSGILINLSLQWSSALRLLSVSRDITSLKSHQSGVYFSGNKVVSFTDQSFESIQSTNCSSAYNYSIFGVSEFNDVLACYVKFENGGKCFPVKKTSCGSVNQTYGLYSQESYFGRVENQIVLVTSTSKKNGRFLSFPQVKRYLEIKKPPVYQYQVLGTQNSKREMMAISKVYYLKTEHISMSFFDAKVSGNDPTFSFEEYYIDLQTCDKTSSSIKTIILRGGFDRLTLKFFIYINSNNKLCSITRRKTHMPKERIYREKFRTNFKSRGRHLKASEKKSISSRTVKSVDGKVFQTNSIVSGIHTNFDGKDFLLLGTRNGNLLKYGMTFQGEHVHLESIFNNTIRPRTMVEIESSDEKFIYGFVKNGTLKEAFRIGIHDCYDYHSCESCFTGDPYCVWCPFKNGCEPRSKTKCGSQVDSAKFCPTISQVSPKYLTAEDNSLVTIEFGNLNETFPNKGVTKCRWTIRGQRHPVITNGSAKDRSASCETPNYIPLKTEFIFANVTVLYTTSGNDPGPMVNGSSLIRFYNCRFFQSCGKCQSKHSMEDSSTFECRWLIKNNTCLWKGKNRELSPCSLYIKSSRKIVAPYNMVSNVTVHGHKFPIPDPKSFKCLINGSKYDFYIESGSTAKCLNVDLTSVPISHFENPIPMNITGKKYGISLENGTNPKILIYNCSKLQNCSFCLSYRLLDDYQCMWIDYVCTTKRGPTQNSSEICGSPKIQQIDTQNGTVEGGTPVKITVTNLAVRKKDLINNVHLAGVPCTVQKVSYSYIICNSGKSMYEHEGPVKLFGKENPTVRFAYKNSSLLSFSPNQCITNVRMNITLNIENFNIGKERSIDLVPPLNSTDCSETTFLKNYTRLNGTHILVTCPYCGSHNAKIDQTIKVQIDGYDLRMLTNETFSSLPFPQIVEQMDNESIKRGGVQIRFKISFPSYSVKFQMLIGPNKTKTNCVSADEHIIKCASPSKEKVSRTAKGPFNISFLSNPSGKWSIGRRFQLSFVENPTFKKFEDEEVVHSVNKLSINIVRGSGLSGAGNDQYTLYIGKSKFINPKLYKDMAVFDISNYPDDSKGKPVHAMLKIGEKYTQDLGKIIIKTRDIWSIIAPVCAVTVIFFICLLIVYVVRRKSDAKLAEERQKFEQHLDRVTADSVTATRNAITAMQTYVCEMSISSGDLPFRSFADFVSCCLIPNGSVDNEPEIVFDQCPKRSTTRISDITKAMVEKFDVELLSSKPFMIALMQTFDRCTGKSERAVLSSAISISLIQKMDFFYDLIDTSINNIVNNHISDKKIDRLTCLFRGADFVVEKMISNWLTICLYSHLRNSDTGKHFYVVFKALSTYINQGPVDVFTNQAMNVLNEELLLAEEVDFQVISIKASLEDTTDMCENSQSMSRHPGTVSLKILSQDTISQVKEKILEAIYDNEPYSRRHTADEVELVWKRYSNTSNKSDSPSSPNGESLNQRVCYIKFDHDAHLYDDNTNQIRTIGFYNNNDILEDAHFVLSVKGVTSASTSESVTSFPSVTDQTMLLQPDEERVPWHLRRPVDQTEIQISKDFLLPHLLKSKQVINPFVENLFKSIFHVGDANELPQFLWHIFHVLDGAVDNLPHNRPCDHKNLLHIWKSNTFILRVWVNLLKNPHFLFDVNNTPTLNSSLSTIAQALMDTCSLAKKSPDTFKSMPMNKVIFMKDVEDYRPWVSDFYRKVASNPSEPSQQDFSIMLQEINRNHEVGGNIQFKAKRYLYNFARHYKSQVLEDIISSSLLHDDAEKDSIKSRIESILFTDEIITCV